MPAPPSPRLTTKIRPAGRGSGFGVVEAWRHRELALLLARRDIRLRYRQTALGATWIVLGPALGAVVLTFVFHTVAGFDADADVPYLVFALVGMATWTGCSQTALRISSVFVSNAQLVTKIWVPRLALAASAVLATLVDLAIGFAIVAVALAVTATPPPPQVLLLPAFLALGIAISAGLGLAAGAVMVRYRDVAPIVTLVLQLALYLSPVAYPAGRVPSWAKAAYGANPLVGVLGGVRWCTFGGPAPSAAQVAASVGAAVGAVALGLFVHRSRERAFADVI